LVTADEGEDVVADDFDWYVAQDADQLLDQLADLVLGKGGLGLGPEDDDARRTYIAGWMRKRLRPLRNLICDDERTRALLSSGNREALLELTTVVDAIVGLGLDRPIATTIVAILLTRGCQALCD
jgi:hypothetical protein